MSFLNHIKKPRSVESLSVDQAMLNYPRRVVNSVFAAVPFQPLSEPLKVVAVSQSALALLTRDKRNKFQVDKELVSVLGGTKGPAASCGWSHCYWGTQFGNYAGQLGDGAAFLIGEGDTGFEINLKGIGKTPFSRGFDGRKVVRSSIREFLCSEAMAGLGISTTRAGSIIMSDKSKVLRDINYTGQPIEENCAVVSRIAKTFFRFGSFESDNPQDTPSIRELARYTWHHLLKPLAIKDSDDSFMDVVIDRTALMVAQWQAVGFVHGVMNTDNMSIIGDTIDYGPFGFVENCDPHFVPNTSDKFGRYALSEQPRAAARNCERLYEVLSFHLRDSPGPAAAFGWRDSERIESQFFKKFNQYYDAIMKQKLGVADDGRFTTIRDRFLKLLDYSAVDYTTAFRAISDVRPSTVDDVLARIMATFPSSERVVQLSAKGLRINAADLPEIEQFAQTRLHELEKVGIDLNTIARWKHKLERIDRFNNLEATENVRVESARLWKDFLAELVPEITDKAREGMKAANPVYIPRQSLIQTAIESVERGENSDQVDRLLNALLYPFDKKDEFSALEAPDLTYSGVCLSCSS